MANEAQRLALLEDQLLVMQREISEVLKETQVTTETLAKTLHMALQTMHVRLVALEKAIPVETARMDVEGKDL